MRRRCRARSSPAARVHLEVRIALEAADLDERGALTECEPVLGSAIGARRPAAADQRFELLVRRAAAQRAAQVDAAHRVETQIPETIGGQAAPVTVRAERRR